MSRSMFTCWTKDRNDPLDATDVEALHAEEAAEKHARALYEKDWDTTTVDGITIFVSDGVFTSKFDITVELEPRIYANEDYGWEPEPEAVEQSEDVH